MGMTLRAVLALSMIACGGKSDEPKPTPGSGSAAGSGAPASGSAAPTGMHVPVVTGGTSPISGNVALAITDGGVQLLGPSPTVDVDDHGQLRVALPAGEPATAANLEAAVTAAKIPPDRTIVFAEPTRSAAALDGVHGFGRSCTNLAVASNGHLAALPLCFPKAMRGDERFDLVTKIAATETLVIVTRLDHTYVAHDPAELDGILAEQKSTPSFHDRTDAVFSVGHDVTIGQLATAVAALHKAGFVDLRWMVEPEAPKPVPPADGSGSGGSGAKPPNEISMAIDCPRVDGGTVDEGARIVKARTGVFRACFQKELPRGAHDGDADVSFGVDKGKVTSVTIAGNVPSPAVAECTKANIQRLVFPQGIRAVRCSFTYKHN